MADPHNADENKSKIEEAARLLQEQQERQATQATADYNNKDNDEPAVMAGFTDDEIGANSKPTTNTPPAHENNAQDLKNEQEYEKSDYKIGTENDTKNINQFLSNEADGRIATGAGANINLNDGMTKAQREKDTKYAIYMGEQQQQLEQLYQEYNEIQAQIAASQNALTNLSSDLRATGNIEDAQIVDDVVEMKDYIVVDYKGKEHIVYRDEENASHIYVIDKESGERVYVNQMEEPDRTNAFKEFNENQRGQKTGDQDPERAKQLEISREKLANNPELLEKFRKDDKQQYAKHQEAAAIKENISNIEENKDKTTTQTTAADSAASATGALNLDTPEYSLDQADAAYNESLAAVENAALTGGTLSQEDYDKLSQSPGMSPEKLDVMMADNKVEIAGQTLGIDSDNTLQNSLGVAANTAVFISFPLIGISGFSVPSIGAPTSEPNPNVTALNYQSFADSPEFAATNPLGETTYNSPVNNGTSNILDASDKFAQATINQPEPDSGLTPDQIEQQRILELQVAEQQRLLAAQNDPFMAGPKPIEDQAG